MKPFSRIRVQTAAFGWCVCPCAEEATGSTVPAGSPKPLQRRVEEALFFVTVSEAATARNEDGRASGVGMRLTSFEEFEDLARRGTFVPVCKEIMPTC